MASELKHENKFTWPFVPRKHRIRYHLNTTGLPCFFFLPLVAIVYEIQSYISRNGFSLEYDFIKLAAKIIAMFVIASTVAIFSGMVNILIDKYLKFAITAEGIYRFRLFKTRFANEDIFFPWDKIKDIRVRKSAFCWFAWNWTVVVNLRMGIIGDLISFNGVKIGDLISLNGFKIGLDDERLQEFLGVIQQCAPESIWQKTQESYNKNK